MGTGAFSNPCSQTGRARHGRDRPCDAGCPAAHAERLRLIRSVVENAAIAEVACNVLIPCLVCSRFGGSWQAPSQMITGFIVLVLNLVGCFLEGCCKSTRLLSQTSRRTQSSHQYVFISSQGFSEGFLNVTTSFPDIASSAGTLALSSNSVAAGVLYCVAHMAGGIILYRFGSFAGWRWAQWHWQWIVDFYQLWQLAIKCFVATICTGIVFLGMAPANYSLGLGGISAVPFDMRRPALPRVSGFMCFPALSIGVVMSVTGALFGCLFSGLLFSGRRRPAARLVTNFLASVLAALAQQAKSPTNFSNPWYAFILLKFSTSFCGALSAFSGTVGDISDSCFGAAREENSFDGVLRGKGWLPVVACAPNLACHFGFTLAVMMTIILAEPEIEQIPEIIIHSNSRRQKWFRERSSTPWLLGV